MDKAEDFLAHYASQYYDPNKAHEYYERTKKLKGPVTPAPKIDKAGKQRQVEAQVYSKNQIKTKGSAEVQKARKDAETKSNAIKSKVKNYFEKQAKEELKIPEGASPKLIALLQKQHGLQDAKMSLRVSHRRKKVAKELQDLLKQLNEKYRKASTTEAENIRTKVR